MTPADAIYAERDGQSVGTASPDARLHGIDAWRAVLLMLGPVVHSAELTAGAMGGGVRWAELVGYGSHVFRMEAFFAVAGFLAGVGQVRGDPGAWLRRRLVQLSVPLAATWLLVLPLAAFLCRRADPGAHWSVWSPWYLWFLLTLLLVTPVGWAAERRGLVRRLVDRADARPRSTWAGVGATWALATALNLAALHLLKPESSVLSVLIGAPYFGTYYAAGGLASRSRAARAHLGRTRWWVAGPLLWLAAMLFFQRFHAELTAPGHQSLHVVGQGLRAATGCAMTYAVLATALRVRAANPVSAPLVRPAYTVYLIHMAPVGLFTWILSPVLASWPLFLLTSILSLAASIAFHDLVVRRSATAAFLLNGRTGS